VLAVFVVVEGVLQGEGTRSSFNGIAGCARRLPGKELLIDVAGDMGRLAAPPPQLLVDVAGDMGRLPVEPLLENGDGFTDSAGRTPLPTGTCKLRGCCICCRDLRLLSGTIGLVMGRVESLLLMFVCLLPAPPDMPSLGGSFGLGLCVVPFIIPL